MTTEKLHTNQSIMANPPRRVKGLNRIGLMALIRKETGRFLAVYTQTIVAPVITTLLFYAVFALAFGGLQQTVNGVSYMEFLAPGLVMMTMVQNAFANTSSSIVIAKVQGNIVDVLMPPLSAGELLTGYVIGGVVRGLVVGIVCSIAISFFVPMHIHSLLYVLSFALLGNVMLATLGIIGGIWSDKFDHIAAFTNFVITPLTFLSGTFYSLDKLPGFWQKLAQVNPFFYMIDGFRFGFIGQPDAHPITGLLFLTAVDLILLFLAWMMIKTGYKIKS